MRAASRLATARTVTVHEGQRRFRDLIRDGSAETASTQDRFHAERLEHLSCERQTSSHVTSDLLNFETRTKEPTASSSRVIENQLRRSRTAAFSRLQPVSLTCSASN